MIIKKHYHVGETLQRSLCEHNGVTCRRITRWVLPDGELAANGPSEGYLWQEVIHTGEFHNVGASLSRSLETAFINALIAANGLSA